MIIRYAPNSWMLSYNMSIWDICGCPEKVSQTLTISVWKMLLKDVRIVGVKRGSCIAEFNPDSSPLYNDNV